MSVFLRLEFKFREPGCNWFYKFCEEAGLDVASGASGTEKPRRAGRPAGCAHHMSWV